MITRKLLTYLAAIFLSLLLPVFCQTSVAQDEFDGNPVNFYGTVADIPQAPDGTAAGYYDPATGDFIISNGAGEDLAGIAYLALLFDADDFDNFNFNNLDLTSGFQDKEHTTAASLEIF